MKKLSVLITVITFMLLNMSCGTIKIREHYYGVDKALPVSEMAILKYDKNMNVYRVNGEKVKWDMTGGEKEIYLNEGEYNFQVQYNDDYKYSKKINIGPYTFEKGKIYVLDSMIIGDRGDFYVREENEKIDFMDFFK